MSRAPLELKAGKSGIWGWDGPAGSYAPAVCSATMIRARTRTPRRSGCRDDPEWMRDPANGANVRLLGYRLSMRSQLSPSYLGFQATGIKRPRRSKAWVPPRGRGRAVPAATRPDPAPPGCVKGAPLGGQRRRVR
jgi:hypothetical protein